MGLVLERRRHESIIIGDDIKVTVAWIDKARCAVKLHIEAPHHMEIDREEIRELKNLASEDDCMEELKITTFLSDDTEVDVFFDYQPPESATLEYPGCQEEVTINAVEQTMFGGIDVLDTLGADEVSRLEIECFESMGGEWDE